MPIITILVITTVLFLFELLYFKIADHYNIIDKPNYRSSHNTITIRGGGIIFAISMVLYPFFFGLDYVYFLSGVLIISLVSFLDDVKPVSNKIRIFFHLLAVALMFVQLEVFNFPVYIIVLALIATIGIVNAINFMDGINGITGAYALITLLSLWYINQYIINYTSNSLILTAGISVLVFNFFNFRKKAKCFAGDVGSVGIAFILLFLIGQLIVYTQNPIYLLLLLIYGLDTISTIIFRLLRKENIFEAHRSHYYQFLANEKKIPHIYVSAGYAITQLLINLLVYFMLPLFNMFSFWALLVSFLALTSGLFIVLRFYTEGKNRLLFYTE